MKVLVLTCSTGGGHNACARYIKEEFNLNNILCDVADYLALINQKTSELVEKLYLDSTKGKGKIFNSVYKIGELYNKSNITSPVYLANKLACDKLIKYIKNNNYDLIICTHLFPSMTLTEINKKERIPFINIATDYECIPFWNETKPDYFIIPSKLLIKSFLKKGISKKILMPLGIPVSSNYKNITNLNLLPTDKDIVLITSGSMGFGNLVSLINKLLLEIPDVYFVVICGNNKKLEESLLKINNNNLKVVGFTKDMNYYLKYSNIVVTKPGGLTSTEVAIINKPFIHMMPIPGVENYNANFFETNKMSLKATNEEEVIKDIQLLLKDKKLQNKLCKNQLKYINSNSARDLVKFIISKY